MLTAVLDASFAPEVIDATQLDGLGQQSRFNLISVALHTAERSTLLKMSKLDEAMDELDASYEALTRAIEASRLSAPPPRCAPSRLLETAEPSPERLRAAAADTTLHRARRIMGTAWTNRLAALLPAGWRLGPCYGKREGLPFDPPCFDSSSARGSARSALCGNSAPAGARAIVSASWSETRTRASSRAAACAWETTS